MSKPSCQHCGARLTTGGGSSIGTERAVFCCAGCVLAERIPVDARGRFPASPALFAAMGIGFGYFNELLFWLFSALLAHKGRLAQADRFLTASMVLGAAVWLVLLVVQWRSGARRWMDVAVAVLTAGTLASGFVAGSAVCVAAGGGGLLVWSARGFFRKKALVESSNGG